MAIGGPPPPLFFDLYARATLAHASEPERSQTTIGDKIARMAADAAREHLEREERAALDYLGIARLTDLLGDGVAPGEAALIAAIDEYHCNRGEPPTAVLATSEQLGALRASVLLAEYGEAPMLERLPDGIPGHRFAAMFCGVPLFVREGA